MATTTTDFAAEREAMVERQIASRGITDARILDAFRTVPREAFISPEYAELAYGDHPLPIEAGQTIEIVDASEAHPTVAQVAARLNR